MAGHNLVTEQHQTSLVLSSKISLNSLVCLSCLFSLSFIGFYFVVVEVLLSVSGIPRKNGDRNLYS